jgi:hypothetical protein
MPKLSKQILLKLSPKLDSLIDLALSKRLKITGIPITKSEFIRQLLEFACYNIDPPHSEDI